MTESRVRSRALQRITPEVEAEVEATLRLRREVLEVLAEEDVEATTPIGPQVVLLTLVLEVAALAVTVIPQRRGPTIEAATVDLASSSCVTQPRAWSALLNK